MPDLCPTADLLELLWAPIESVQGAYRLIRLVFERELPDGSVVPEDVSASTWAAQIRRRYESPAALATLETHDVSAAASGIVVLRLATTAASTLPAGHWVWDVFRITAGEPQAVAMGTWTVLPRVTR